MANGEILTAEQERQLRQPIDEYVGKIQKEIDTNNSIIEKTDEKIQNAQEKIIEYEMSIKDLEKQKIEFEKINRNLFTKAINYKKYKSYKNIEFEKRPCGNRLSLS